MASNVRPHGNNVSIEVGSDVVSGDIVRQGNLVGVAQYDATRGNDGAMYTVVAIEGVGNAVSTDTSGYVVGEPIFAVGANGEPCDTSPTDGDVVLGIVTAVTPDRVWFKLSPAVSSGGGADIDWADVSEPGTLKIAVPDVSSSSIELTPERATIVGGTTADIPFTLKPIHMTASTIHLNGSVNVAGLVDDLEATINDLTARIEALEP